MTGPSGNDPLVFAHLMRLIRGMPWVPHNPVLGSVAARCSPGSIDRWLHPRVFGGVGLRAGWVFLNSSRASWCVGALTFRVGWA